MAYLSVDFPAKTVTGFTLLSFVPPLVAPFQSSLTATAGLGAVIIPFGVTMLPVPPQTSGGAAGGSVGYPH